jgi:hypothetical protein
LLENYSQGQKIFSGKSVRKKSSSPERLKARMAALRLA